MAWPTESRERKPQNGWQNSHSQLRYKAYMVGPVIQVPSYSRFEAAFESRLAYDNPVQDVRVTVEFTAPASEFRGEAFWDGERCWRIRFSPSSEGVWTWRTSCSQPEDVGLHDINGSFECRKITAAPGLLSLGPLQVSADHRHLQSASGNPFFWLADTAWNGPLKATQSDWDLYLADRSQKGFSVIQFVATHWLGAAGDSEGRPAYTNPERIRIEPAFFQRLDQRIDRINDFQMVAAPVLAWAATWNQGSLHLNPGSSLIDEQLIVLIRYLVSRYGAHHVVWILAGDGIYEGAEAQRWRRIGKAALSDSHRLATIHPSGRLWVDREFEPEAWYSFVGYQSGQWNDAQSSVFINSPHALDSAGRSRPVIDLEPCYEDHRPLDSSGRAINAQDVRRSLYWSLLARPVAGVSYGAHGVWSWENFPAVPLSHPNSGIARPWHEAMKFPGSYSASNLQSILRSIEWWRLDPSPQLLAAQPGNEEPLQFIAAASSRERDLALIYAPIGGTVLLRPGVLALGLEVICIDPANGTQQWNRPLDQRSDPIMLDCGSNSDRLLLIRPCRESEIS